MTDALGVISSQSFLKCVPLVMKTFFLANFPCSDPKYQTLKQMHVRSVQFLVQASAGQTWMEPLLQQVSSFDPESLRLAKLGELAEPLNTLRMELFGRMGREELHEALIWFFMCSTDQLLFDPESKQCTPKLIRSIPLERDCLYELLKLLSGDGYRDLLCRYEQLYSAHLSKQMPSKESDPRVASAEGAVNVAQALDNCCRSDRNQ